MGAAANARAGLGFRGQSHPGHSKAGRRGTSPFDKVTSGESMREKKFVGIHKAVVWELVIYLTAPARVVQSESTPLLHGSAARSERRLRTFPSAARPSRKLRQQIKRAASKVF